MSRRFRAAVGLRHAHRGGSVGRPRRLRSRPRRQPWSGRRDATVDLARMRAESGVDDVLDALDRELVGLGPVKTRIREIAALLLVDRLRREQFGLDRRAAQPAHVASPATPAPARPPSRCGWPTLLHRLGYLRKGHLVSGHPRRPGRPVRRPHRAQDQGGAQAGDGRRAVHRRGLLPLPARERARLRPGVDRDPAAGHGEPPRRPGGDPRRLQGPDGRRSSAPTRA